MMLRTIIPKNASGIYQIQSVITKRRYVGSSICINKRIKDHLKDLQKGKHPNIFLQYHINKYGLDDLGFSIIEFCPKEELIEREQFYISTIKPKFNICSIVGRPPIMIGYKHTEETKQNMSIAQKTKAWNSEKRRELARKRRLGIPSGMKGKYASEETKKKMSISQTGRSPTVGFTGRIHSKETKEKIRLKHLGFKHSEETKQVLRIVNIGIKKSKETRKKMSESSKRAWLKRRENVA